MHRAASTVLACTLCIAAQAAGHSVQRLPLVFEENRGQTDPQVKFYARSAGYTMFLTGSETVLSLGGSAFVRMKLDGANQTPAIEGEQRLLGRSSYFLGNEPEQWRTGIPQYGKVRYREVYPGIDMIFYGNRRQVEIDFIVQPKAGAAQIRLSFAECRSLEIDAAGDLKIQTSAGEIRFAKPRAYQLAGNESHAIAGDYVLLGDRTAGFKLGSYDASLPLVIDPVVYGTFLGGSGDDRLTSFSVDAWDHLYVTGYTDSLDFPGASYLATQPARRRVFVAKLNQGGTQLEYVAIVGGSDSQSSAGIAVDTAGNAFISGWTTSPDFPTTAGAHSRAGNSFVFKLNASGTELLYSTRGVGGLIALDAAGSAYLAGKSDAPASAVFGSGQGFRVSKLSADGSRLIYSADLRGGWVTSLAVDEHGSAYISGHTYTPSGFPTTPSAFDRGDSGIERYDAFVTKLTPDGTDLAYSTLLGISRYAHGSEISVDSSGSAYVSGTTDPCSANVTRLNPSGSDLIYSADFGPVYSDINDVATTYLTLAPSGQVWVSTLSRARQVEVRRLNGAGSLSLDATPLFSVESMYDLPRIRRSCSGDLYLAGTSLSPLFPLTGEAIQSQSSGGHDASIVRFRPDGQEPTPCILNSANLRPGAPVAPQAIASIFGDGLASSTRTAATPEAILGGASVRIRDSQGAEHQGRLYYASSNQINFLVPRETAIGPAKVAVSVEGKLAGQGDIEIAAVAPGIYAANGNGHGVAAATVVRTQPRGAKTVEPAFECTPERCTALPINLSDRGDQVALLLFANGFRGLSGPNAISATVGGESVAVQYTGSVEGVDQLSLLLPRTLAGRGDVEVNVLVDGRLANAVSIRIQ